MRAQASLIFFTILATFLSREKYLDYVLAYLVDITVEKCNEKAVKSICRTSHAALIFKLKLPAGHLNDELPLWGNSCPKENSVLGANFFLISTA